LAFFVSLHIALSCSDADADRKVLAKLVRQMKETDPVGSMN
jgi:hypothetical protein